MVRLTLGSLAHLQKDLLDHNVVKLYLEAFLEQVGGGGGSAVSADRGVWSSLTLGKSRGSLTGPRHSDGFLGSRQEPGGLENTGQ